ncbi:MAG: ABC transporter ATP-binding protein [Candidatus Hodarchaeota archaeon]
MSDSNTVLQLDNVTKIYTSGIIQITEVVGAKDVSFTIEQGEILSLVGESGSGKSTIANIILRLLEPTGGDLYFDSKSIYSYAMKDYYNKVQVVFQDPYGSFNLFYKIDRVLNNAFNLRKEKISTRGRKQIIQDILNQIGLNPEEVLGRYPHQLSGGQLQRFLLARVLIIRPKLLIADEMTSMIDASSRAGILNLLEDLRDDEGLSILFITHDIGQAQYISDNVVVMQRGEIVEKGPCKIVLTEPHHSYTKELLRSVPTLKERWDFIKY